MLYKLDSVSRRYRVGANRVVALDQIQLEIDAGAFVAVTGPSGSGKSSLIHILSTTDVNFDGDLYYRGRPVRNWSTRQAQRYRLTEIGLLFQRFHLFGGLNVKDNVALPYWRLTGDRRAAIGRATALLEQFDLADYLNIAVERLSTGQMQRVALARALINEPEVLFADEPTAHLDAVQAAMIGRLLQEIQQKGKTVIVATHDRELIELAEQNVALAYGRVVKTESINKRER